MIRTVFTKLGFVRSALVAGVGIPFLIASAYAQTASPTPPITSQASDVPVQASGNQASGADQAAASTERIIVTGSYIPTAETESALPVTVYTAETLIKQGAQTPVEGLRQLPSFVGNTITENDSNAGDGAASVNLRGLGAENTLTLVNGRRAFLGDGTEGAANINLLGLGELSRTEVLKDGASSIYGSDAVAGVVNFLLLDAPGQEPYQGAELFLLYGNTTEKDAHVRQVYLKGGVVGLDGKLAIAAAAEYYSRATLRSSDRLIAQTGDLSNDALGLGLGGQNTNSPTFGGHIAVAPGTPGLPAGFNGQLVLTDLTNATPTGFGDYRQFDAIPGTDPSRFNFRSVTPAIPGQERFSYYVAGSYKIFGDGLQAYGDVLYTHDTQDNGLAGAPFLIANFTGSVAFPQGDLGIFQNSPFNPFGANLTQLRYRLQNELGNRRSFFDRDLYRYEAGVRGDFNFQDNPFISHFGYDSGFVYSRYDLTRTDSGDATESGIDLATQGLDTTGNGVANLYFDPFIGINAPQSGLAPTFVNGVPTGNFLPYNNTAAAQTAAFIATTHFYERDYLADVKLNAHLFPNLYNGGIDIAGGYEHREIRTQTLADPTQAANDQLGFNGGADAKFTQSVDSVFGELSIPFVTSTLNIPGVRSFEISLAYRYEKFDDTNNFNNTAINSASFDNANPNEDFGGSPRLTIRYQPIADVTLRATASQSFLAPTPNQLFAPVVQDFTVLFDPAIGTTLQPPLGEFEGSNAGLSPEKTDSYTAGIVYSPSFVRGLTLTADYYQLFTTDLVIGAAAFAQVLLTNGVVDPDGPGAGSTAFIGVNGGPGLGVTRDAQGNVLAVDSAAGNAGRRNVQGLDLTAIYQIPTQNLGTFTVSGGLNHFFTYKVEATPGAGFSNFLGDFSASLPLAPGAIPFNKAFLRTEWEWKGFDFLVTENYIGDYEDDPNFILERGGVFQDFVPGNPGTGANPNFILHRRVSSYFTTDAQLSYTFPKPPPVEAAPEAGYSKDAKDGKGMVQQTAVSTAAPSANIFQRILWDTTLTVGVNNAFDRQPPTTLGAFNDNYDTSLYNIRNRYYYLSLTKKF